MMFAIYNDSKLVVVKFPRFDYSLFDKSHVQQRCNQNLIHGLRDLGSGLVLQGHRGSLVQDSAVPHPGVVMRYPFPALSGMTSRTTSYPFLSSGATKSYLPVLGWDTNVPIPAVGRDDVVRDDLVRNDVVLQPVLGRDDVVPLPVLGRDDIVPLPGIVAYVPSVKPSI